MATGVRLVRSIDPNKAQPFISFHKMFLNLATFGTRPGLTQITYFLSSHLCSLRNGFRSRIVSQDLILHQDSSGLRQLWQNQSKSKDQLISPDFRDVCTFHVPISDEVLPLTHVTEVALVHGLRFDRRSGSMELGCTVLLPTKG